MDSSYFAKCHSFICDEGERGGRKTLNVLTMEWTLANVLLRNKCVRLTPVDSGSCRQREEPRLASRVRGSVLELTTVAVNCGEEKEERKTEVWQQRY